MNISTVIVLVIIATAVILAIIYMVKHQTGCSGCNGCGSYDNCTKRNSSSCLGKRK